MILIIWIHGLFHLGLALLKGIKLLGMYPGGFGVGYGYKFIKG